MRAPIRLAHAAAACLVASLAGACSSYIGSARDFSPASMEREAGWIAVAGVPPVRQETEVECGAAAVAMVVSYWTGTAPGRLVAALRPVPRRGLAAGRLREFARGHGLAAFLIQAELADLEHEIARGRPVLVGLAKPQRRGVLAHYEVVVALHPASRRIVTLDPGHGWRENSFAGFLGEWRPVRGLALIVSPAARRRALDEPRRHEGREANGIFPARSSRHRGSLVPTQRPVTPRAGAPARGPQAGLSLPRVGTWAGNRVPARGTRRYTGSP